MSADRAQSAPILLAIETSTEICGCALWRAGKVELREFLAPQQHADLLLGEVNTLVDNAGLSFQDLDGILFGRGPGSFTGVRIACAVAQGLGFALDRPVLGVSSLTAIAEGLVRRAANGEVPALPVGAVVLPGFDARMGEVYWGGFEVSASGDLEARFDECVVGPDYAPIPEAVAYVGVGSAWGSYSSVLSGRVGPRHLTVWADDRPSAFDVATIGAKQWMAGARGRAEDASPVYLRNDVVHRTERIVPS